MRTVGRRDILIQHSAITSFQYADGYACLGSWGHFHGETAA
jgi:hypothetical protein